MPIVIDSDGSSTVDTGSGRGSSGSAIVSPIVTSGRPASATISPGPASSAETRSSASVMYSSTTFAFEIVPSAWHHAIGAPLRSHAVPDAAEREPADVRVGVEVRHERLQRMLRVVLRRRNRREQRLDERPEIGREIVGRQPGAAGARVAVDDRELDLRLVRVEVEEQLVHLVDDLLRARVVAVDLVHDEDDGQFRLQRLAQDEARLRQRALARVDEQQHAVDHRQPALDLAAEVGVARRVDDVELRVADPDGGVLGEDRDALLALEIHRVHDALVDVLILAKRAGLPEQGVDERRLPMVDVGDDCEVAEVFAAGHTTAHGSG